MREKKRERRNERDQIEGEKQNRRKETKQYHIHLFIVLVAKGPKNPLWLP